MITELIKGILTGIAATACLLIVVFIFLKITWLVGDKLQNIADKIGIYELEEKINDLFKKQE